MEVGGHQLSDTGLEVVDPRGSRQAFNFPHILIHSF